MKIKNVWKHHLVSGCSKLISSVSSLILQKSCEQRQQNPYDIPLYWLVNTWNLKHLFINGCFTKHPFKTGCLGYQATTGVLNTAHLPFSPKLTEVAPSTSERQSRVSGSWTPMERIRDQATFTLCEFRGSQKKTPGKPSVPLLFSQLWLV